jgi:hypothetical protein
MTLPQADSTIIAMRKKIRRLTNSSNSNSLTDYEIDQHINDIYNQDFAYGIKVDQMRSVYTLYTQPNIDRYPLDINYNQGIRAPAYFDGIQGSYFKDRTQFFNLWPRIPTLFQPISGDGVTQSFTFNIPGPFLSLEVVLGGVSTTGTAIQVRDDGNGNLYVISPNPQTFTPPFNTNPAIPGMYNGNLGDPGLNNPIYVGSVDYVAGNFTVNFSLANLTPTAGQNMMLWVSQYQTGRPYTLLFWNNVFTVRPVPKLVHKIEVETYLTPVQFMSTTDHPIVNQWWKYLCYLSAAEIQRERNDFEAVAALQEGAKRQEALVLERQGVEEIDVPNINIFNSTTPNPYLNNFWGITGY